MMSRTTLIAISVLLVCTLGQPVYGQPEEPIDLEPVGINLTAVTRGIYDVEVEVSARYAGPFEGGPVTVEMWVNDDLVDVADIVLPPLGWASCSGPTPCVPICPFGWECIVLFDHCMCVLNGIGPFHEISLPPRANVVVVVDPGYYIPEFDETNNVYVWTSPIPTVSAWGLLILALLLLAGAKVYFGQRRQTA